MRECRFPLQLAAFRRFMPNTFNDVSAHPFFIKVQWVGLQCAVARAEHV